MRNIVNRYLDHQTSAIKECISEHITKRTARMTPVSFLAGPKRIPVIFVHNTYGQRVYLDPADYFISTHYLELLDWEDHLEEVYKESLKNGGVYLDIGGNIGLHVLRAHRLGATAIYAFEPNPNTYEILVMNMRLNGMHSNFFGHALGDKDGHVRMNVTDYSAGMARIEEGKDHLLEVPIKMLNTFGKEHPELANKKLSLVKMDVEGHEGEVISGAIDFLRNYSNFNMIIEFGSPSSVRGLEALDKCFDFTMKLYRWGRPTIDCDMSFVSDPKKRTGGDLVLFNLKPKK